MVKISTLDYSMTASTVLQSTNEDLSNAGGFEINLVDGLIYGYAYDSQAGVEVFVHMMWRPKALCKSAS